MSSHHANYPFPVKKVKIQPNLELAYMEAGQGETTFLFVHGFASYAPIWEKNIQSLQKYFHCLAIDLPGHGLSDMGDFEYSIDFYAQAIQDFLKCLAIEKCVLIGHSMGGQISIYMAVKKPDLFSHLVLVAPAGFETFSLTEKVLLNQFAVSGILSSSQYLRFALNLKNYFYELNEKEFQKLNEFNRDFFSILANPHLSKVLDRSIRGMMDRPVWDELKKISLPTLVFFGKNDQLIPHPFLHANLSTEAIARAGAERIKHCKLRIYEKCGHFLQFEKAAEFNIDLYKFLHPAIYRDFDF
jgi:pimeloyl-ACP methyl ester carboxylesterase